MTLPPCMNLPLQNVDHREFNRVQIVFYRYLKKLSFHGKNYKFVFEVLYLSLVVFSRPNAKNDRDRHYDVSAIFRSFSRNPFSTVIFMILLCKTDIKVGFKFHVFCNITLKILLKLCLTTSK